MSVSNDDTIGHSEKKLLQQRLIVDLCQETITKLQIFQRGLRLNAPIIATKTTTATTKATSKQHKSSSSKARNQKSKKSTKEKNRKMHTSANDTTTTTNNKNVVVDHNDVVVIVHIDNHDDDDDDENENMENMPDERILNAIKMDKELDMLVEIFSTAAIEIGRNGLNVRDDGIGDGVDVCVDVGENQMKSSEKTLKELIATLQANDNEVDKKTKELRTKQLRLQLLKTEIETVHKQSFERMHSKDERIANLRHNLRNVRRLNDLEFDLVTRWETNRFKQAEIVCQNEEHALRNEIKNLDRQINGEKRIINEVEKFNAKQFEEYRAKINDWKTKYANEMAKVTSETMEHEKRIMELSKIHERHEQTYAERVKFVREYLEKKAVEQRLYEQQMYRVECAIKLQAWWRGVMVRRGLGPYKKKAKKGKKGKGKGK